MGRDFDGTGERGRFNLEQTFCVTLKHPAVPLAEKESSRMRSAHSNFKKAGVVDRGVLKR